MSSDRFHVAPTNRDLLRENAMLPEHLKQCAVVLRFGHMLKSSDIEQFYRIHLSREMLAGGEEDFYRPHIMQPERMGQVRCGKCGQYMEQFTLMQQRCMNPVCENRGLILVSGPVRGVHKVQASFEAVHPRTKKTVEVSFIVGHDTVQGPYNRTVPVQLVNGCLVVLDRRYDATVLAAVKRTCGHLCDMKGWRLL